MNRQQRRTMEKKGAQTQAGELRYLQTPCTIAEAAQIARGVAEDVMTDYNRQESHLKIAMSLQIEILKDIVISAGLITEEEFRAKYMQRAEEFNKMQQEAMLRASEESEESEDMPIMQMSTDEVEVTKE